MRHSLDYLFAFLAVVGLLAVAQTFIIGKHYIIPTGILALTLLLGVFARNGLKGKPWAKHTLFWWGVLLTAHFFFALFWSVAYRTALGASFEPVCGVVVLVLAYLTWRYARDNELFS